MLQVCRQLWFLSQPLDDPFPQILDVLSAHKAPSRLTKPLHPHLCKTFQQLQPTRIGEFTSRMSGCYIRSDTIYSTGLDALQIHLLLLLMMMLLLLLFCSCCCCYLGNQTANCRTHFTLNHSISTITTAFPQQWCHENTKGNPPLGLCNVTNIFN